MNTIQRFTTAYSKPEDRFLLHVIMEADEVQSLMLTQRLLLSLLPRLFKWIEELDGDDLRGELTRGFKQQAARRNQEKRPPVEVTEDALQYLVTSIKVRTKKQGVRLVFEFDQDQKAALALSLKGLRQWLNILCDTWKRAGWAMEVWPDWVSESHNAAGKSAKRAVH